MTLTLEVVAAMLELFLLLPWAPQIGRMYSTLFRNREEKEDPGGYLTSDGRGNLRRMHEEFEKKHSSSTCTRAS